MRDEKGAWSQQHVTINVTGGADAPILVGKLPNAIMAEITEAGVVPNTNTDVDGSIHVNGQLVATSTAAGTRSAPSRSSRSTQERARGI